MGRRVLFFPSFRGGGFGHVGRCLALAEALRDRGWEAAFVLDGPHAARVEAAGYPVLRPRLPPAPDRLTALLGKGARLLARWLRRLPPPPAYLVFSDLNFQVLRDGLVTPTRVRRRVGALLALVHRFRPHLLVGDTHLLTRLVGRRAGLPVVQIVKSVVHPAAPRLIWWQEPPAGLLSPDVRPVFNPLLEAWGLPPIRRAEELLDGDLLLVPSIPELDPLPPNLERTHYVGALVRRDPRAVAPAPWFEALSPRRPVVYVTVGGGADLVDGPPFFETVYDAVIGTAWQVVVASGRFDPRQLPSPPPSVRLERWVPGRAMIARADAVLFHGGYGTTMEVVAAGKPAVIVPFHTEQEANGRRLEAAGAARVLPYARPPYCPLEGRWPGGRYAMLMAPTPTLSPQEVHAALTAVLHEPSFRQAAARLQRALSGYGGPDRAAELVLSLTEL
ncbi:MAG TPA: hypothetical protein ENK56_10615 [Chloroflexi bacterium]|nr:hypothetical protein [Chloroflexota bacterium]